MAKLRFIPDSNAKNVITPKQAKYIKRRNFWRWLFLISLTSNLGQIIWTTDFLNLKNYILTLLTKL
jgi:hypothetical protein